MLNTFSILTILFICICFNEKMLLFLLDAVYVLEAYLISYFCKLATLYSIVVEL